MPKRRLRSVLDTFKERRPRRDRFTPPDPPRSGTAKRLWDWWIRHEGQPPDELSVVRAGHWQRSQGAAQYIIRYKGTAYPVWDAELALQATPQDSIYHAGDYLLGLGSTTGRQRGSQEHEHGD